LTCFKRTYGVSVYVKGKVGRGGGGGRANKLDSALRKDL